MRIMSIWVGKYYKIEKNDFGNNFYIIYIFFIAVFPLLCYNQ